jgi:hypothetical protein
MRTCDNNSNTVINGRQIVNPSTPRFADVLRAVDDAPNLTKRVRQNMRSAVIKTAELMSPLGLSGLVDIPAIGKNLGKLAPAQLGYRHPGSMAACKSNFRRALRLAGVAVMPGRHVVPLSAEWTALTNRVSDRSIRIPLSRFSHVASEQGWEPNDIGPGHLERFARLVGETCLGSKTSKLVRMTVAAWERARATVPGWPQNPLCKPEKSGHSYALPWTAFPESFRADVHDFISRPDIDLLDDKPSSSRFARGRWRTTGRPACELPPSW